MDKEQKLDFDQDLYSRQLSTYGPEMMQKLIKLRVFVQGLRGIGVETCKNLILAGPKKVVIHDDTKVEMRDLGSNFYCKEQDVGKVSRAEASLSQLKELNPYVEVSQHTGVVNEEVLKDFDVIVFTENYDGDFLHKMNEWARSQSPAKGFIWSGILGLYGFTFVDFGKGFEVLDKDGEDPKTGIVTQISSEEKAKVVTHARHNLQDGDYVRLKEVEGMTEINGKIYKIKTVTGQSFEIEEDTTKFTKYVRNGQFEQVKVPIKIDFKSLKDSLVNPNDKQFPPLENPDMVKFGRPEQLHVGINALLRFTAAHNGELPRVNNDDDANVFIKACEEYNAEDPDNKDRIRNE